MSSKPAKPSDRPELLPQTSEDKFKASGFGSFASSAASPFGGLSNPPASTSPFGATGGNKLSSFASSAASATSGASLGGFGALGSSNKLTFGGGPSQSSFGGGFSGGFAGASAKPLTSFGGSSNLTITGLETKPRGFGMPGDKPASAAGADEEDGGDATAVKDNNEEERGVSQALLSQQRKYTTFGF
jgi:Ran-binding protein 3